jgi:pimeloyl-[acyl-carrier protein] methyl ester esterase
MGKPILLIHGWNMHSGVWDDFVQEFAAKYRIITVDLRGHGKSVSVE